MWAMLRVVLVEWILARLGLRWLVTLLIGVPIALLVFVGLPALLVCAVLVFVAWRFLRRPTTPA